MRSRLTAHSKALSVQLRHNHTLQAHCVGPPWAAHASGLRPCGGYEANAIAVITGGKVQQLYEQRTNLNALWPEVNLQGAQKSAQRNPSPQLTAHQQANPMTRLRAMSRPGLPFPFACGGHRNGRNMEITSACCALAAIVVRVTNKSKLVPFRVL